jgi:hypothetical protein
MADGDDAAAKRYLKRAHEVRIIAEEIGDKAHQRILLNVAEDYERMAKTRTAISDYDKGRLANPPKESASES